MRMFTLTSLATLSLSAAAYGDGMVHEVGRSDRLPPWGSHGPYGTDDVANDASRQEVGRSDKLPPWGSHGPYGTDRPGQLVVTSEPLPPWGSHALDGFADERPVEDSMVAADDSDEGVNDLTLAHRDEVGALSGRCEVIATSPGAVGQPCETTRSFMESLGLSQAQMVRVEEMSAPEN